jgi:hypothetical protein
MLNTTMKKVVGMHRVGRGLIRALSEDLPPLGVGIELHREIMRRINNRYFDTKDLCSMRRGGPGLAELAGVIPLTEGLGSEAIAVYAGHLEKVISTRGHCERCEAKVYAILFLVAKAIDPARAGRYMRMVLRCKAALGVVGQHRDFLAEVQAAADQESRRMAERDARRRRIVTAWQE